MAELDIGTLVARLKGDTGDFARQMQAAMQLLQQVVAQLGQLRQADTSTGQSTKQLSAEFGALATAIKEQTTAYTQSAAAALAYTQQQDALQAALKKQQDEQRKATEETRKGSDAWKQLLQTAAGFGIATGIQSVVRELKDFVVSIVETGAKIEQLKASLGAIAGDARAGGTQFQFLIDTAQRLGFDVLKLADGFRQFSGATRGTALAGEETRKIFTGMTEAARAMGASSEQTGHGLLALGQIVSKGVVSMEELRQQLAEAIPGSFQIAARAIGMTTEELNKMVSEGTIRAIPFVRALGRQMHEEFGPLAKGAADTATAAFARLGNEILLLKDRIANSGLLSSLQAIASTMATVLRGSREAREAAELLDTTTAEANRIGTGVRDRDLTAQQRERLAVIRQGRAALEGSGNATVESAFAFATGRTEKLLEGYKAEEAAIYAIAKAAREEADAKEKAAAPGKRAEFLRQQERDTIEALTEKFTANKKALDDLNATARITPEVLGSLTGDSEARITFLTERAKILKESLDTITKLLIRRPAGGEGLPPGLATDKADTQQQLRTTLAQIEAIKKAQDDAKTAESEASRAARQADQEALRDDAERRRIAMATGAEALRAIDAEMAAQDKALETLRRLSAAYTQTKEARDVDTASALAAQFPGNEAIQTEAATVKSRAATRDAYNAEVEALKDRFIALKQNADAVREGEAAQEQYNQRLQDTLEKLRAPKDERVSVSLRQKAPGGDTTHEQDAMLEQIRAQERLNYTISLFESMAGSVGQAWTGALTSIADGTKTVAGAFRDMARSIMQSMAQLASQEAFKALINLGARLIAGAVGGAFGGESAYGSAIPGMSTSPEASAGFAAQIAAIPHAGGGIINRPTLAMLGENPANNPEIILNRQQMQQFMSSAGRAGPSAGGQAAGGNIVIVNYTDQNRSRAEQEAASQRAQGHTVVMNVVMSDLQKGESSQIMRSIRTQAR